MEIYNHQVKMGELSSFQAWFGSIGLVSIKLWGIVALLIQEMVEQVLAE
jgi:hypothetical protein